MATAPRPGVTTRKVEVERAQVVLTITVRDDKYRLAIGTVPIKEKQQVRHQTGLPLEAYLGSGDKLGEDSIVVLWWLARRAAGEPSLTWDQAADEWPNDLAAGELSFSVDRPDGEDPEA